MLQKASAFGYLYKEQKKKKKDKGHHLKEE